MDDSCLVFRGIIAIYACMDFVGRTRPYSFFNEGRNTRLQEASSSDTYNCWHHHMNYQILFVFFFVALCRALKAATMTLSVTTRILTSYVVYFDALTKSSHTHVFRIKTLYSFNKRQECDLVEGLVVGWGIFIVSGKLHQS